MSLSRTAAGVVGPAVGGTLVALISPGVAVAGDAATFLVSAGSLALLRLEWPAREAMGASMLTESGRRQPLARRLGHPHGGRDALGGERSERPQPASGAAARAGYARADDRTIKLSAARSPRELLRQAPELAGQPDPVEDRLVLLARVRPPVGREAVVPPCVREIAERRDRDRRARLAAGEPALDVLLRPEEVHRASGEDDVVPPVRGGHEAVEQEAFVVRLLAAHLNGDRLAAVGTGGLDAAVDVQRGADPEGVPGAVAVPRAAGRLHAVGRRDGGEGIRHADFAARGVEHERVRVVEPAPALRDLRPREPRRFGNLFGARHPPELDEEPVGQVAELEVATAYAGLLGLRPLLTTRSIRESGGSTRPALRLCDRTTPFAFRRE